MPPGTYADHDMYLAYMARSYHGDHDAQCITATIRFRVKSCLLQHWHAGILSWCPDCVMPIAGRNE
eukprot:1195708-Prorocentrum_minimum.AAC.9